MRGFRGVLTSHASTVVHLYFDLQLLDVVHAIESVADT
jgi:hypothetical protein